MLHVVVGGQFGSEGKGNVTAWVTRGLLQQEETLSVRVGGPNAGHCVVDATGRKWALRTLPVGAVLSHTSPIYIAEGSEIDPSVLLTELLDTEAAGYNTFARLVVDRSATVITSVHTIAPLGRPDTGRTGKGVGGARAARLRKTAHLWGDWSSHQGRSLSDDLFDLTSTDTAPLLRRALDRGLSVVIEGTQGYGLGTHSGYYPHVTSGDCRAIDFIAQAGIDPYRAAETEVWLVARVHPIRIAGPSGPLQGETTWDQLGVDPEYTTVTHKVRRVGTWDPELVGKAIDANGRPTVVLTFFDYIAPDVHGLEQVPHLEAIRAFERTIDYDISYVGTSDVTIAEVLQ